MICCDMMRCVVIVMCNKTLCDDSDLSHIFMGVHAHTCISSWVKDNWMLVIHIVPLAQHKFKPTQLKYLVMTCLHTEMYFVRRILCNYFIRNIIVTLGRSLCSTLWVSYFYCWHWYFMLFYVILVLTLMWHNVTWCNVLMAALRHSL